jgi:YVTN family beta-propeller protein
VRVINTQTNAVVGSPIAVGSNPVGIAITPNGSRAYVTNNGGGTVSVINTQTNAVVGSPIAVGTSPRGIAITPTARARTWPTTSGTTSPSSTPRPT